MAVLVACKNESETQEIINDHLAKIEKEVTPDEYQQIKEDISAYFYDGHFSDLNEYVDYKALLSITLDNMETGDLSENYFDMIVAELSNETDFWENTAWGTDFYDLIKEYVNEEGYSVLVYRAYGEEGINYDEYVLGKIEGKIKIIDVFNVASGQLLSETLREIVENILGSKNTQLDPNKTKLLVQQTVTAYQSGDYETAVNTFNQLPEELKSTRVMRLMEFSLYMWYDEDIYKEKIEQYKEDYPHSASVDLMLIDYYTVKEEYDMAIASIEAVEELYPDDGALDYFKASVYLELNDCKSAVNSFQNATISSPEILDFKDGLSIAYMDCNQKEKGFEVVDELVDLGYYEYSDFELYLSIVYEDYESWPEYQQWISQY